MCERYQQAPLLQAHGVQLLSTAEKTGSQARERLQPTRPLGPGLVERTEFEYLRHGTQPLIANFVVATGQGLAPTVGSPRTEADFAFPIARTIQTAPVASWIFLGDHLNTHQSETLVRLVATLCELPDD